MSETPVAETEAKHPSRGRGVAAVVCVVLAALLTTPAAVAFWGQRTLNDTQRYVETVGPLVDSPEVQDAIATKVTDAIQQQVDVEALLNQVFAGVIDDRPRLQLLVGPSGRRGQRADRVPGARLHRLRHLRRPLGHREHQGPSSCWSGC